MVFNFKLSKTYDTIKANDLLLPSKWFLRNICNNNCIYIHIMISGIATLFLINLLCSTCFSRSFLICYRSSSKFALVLIYYIQLNPHFWTTSSQWPFYRHNFALDPLEYIMTSFHPYTWCSYWSSKAFDSRDSDIFWSWICIKLQ